VPLFRSKNGKAKKRPIWYRPEGMKRIANKSKWTEEQDKIVNTYDSKTAAKMLNRSLPV